MNTVYQIQLSLLVHSSIITELLPKQGGGVGDCASHADPNENLLGKTAFELDQFYNPAPCSHRYTWIGMGKNRAHKQQEYLTGSKCWLWCLCSHTPGLDSGPSSTYWRSNSTISNISFPSLPTVTMCLYFLLFLLSLFTNLICFYNFRSAGDPNKGKLL